MKVVTIQSNINITVTSGLDYIDLTPKGAEEMFHGTADVLKVKANFSHILIKQGQAEYPAEVAEWPSVKALQKDGLLSIGVIKEIDTEKEEAEKKAAEKKAKIDAVPQIKTLNDIAK